MECTVKEGCEWRKKKLLHVLFDSNQPTHFIANPILEGDRNEV